MKIRIKYRVHGMGEGILQPGTVVDLDEAAALPLLRQGAAEELDTGEHALSTGKAGSVNEAGEAAARLQVELTATAAARDAAEKEAAGLRKRVEELENQVKSLNGALEKAKAKAKDPEKAQGGA